MGKKIYVVTSGSYSDYGIERVFKDKRKAEIYCATRNTQSDLISIKHRIEEYEIADEKIEYEADIKTAYRFEIFESDKKSQRKSGILKRVNEIDSAEVIRERYSGELLAIITIPTDSWSKAFKIAQDMFARCRYEKEC